MENLNSNQKNKENNQNKPEISYFKIDNFLRSIYFVIYGLSSSSFSISHPHEHPQHAI